jgi:hypothetical protein
VLIRDFVLQNYPIESWQGFREKELWCQEVTDVIESNLPSLEYIWTSFTNPQKKFPDQLDMIKLCMQISPCGISEIEVKFCYGMCKMTVVVEATGYKEYSRLQFVEFLEFVGRIANAKFKHNVEMS